MAARLYIRLGCNRRLSKHYWSCAAVFLEQQSLGQSSVRKCSVAYPALLGSEFCTLRIQFCLEFLESFCHSKERLRLDNLMGIVLITPVFFIAALPVLLPVLGARYRWGVTSPEVLLYWLCGGAMWIAELHRKDMTHLIFGSPLLIILCVYFLAEYREAIAGSALQLLSISAACLAGFNLLVTLLAAHPIITRVGTVYTFRELPGLKYLETHTSRGDEIFAYPYCPRYYFLSDTTNPTPYFILTYNYNTPSQFQEVVRILDRAQGSVCRVGHEPGSSKTGGLSGINTNATGRTCCRAIS